MKKTSRGMSSPRPSSSFSIGDKLKIIVFLFLLLVFPLLFLHFYSVHLQKKSISRTVEEWKSVYHINNEQIGRIKQIEFDFHGSGSPFDKKGARSRVEKQHHHEAIAALMSPEDGARFLKEMEGERKKH